MQPTIVRKKAATTLLACSLFSLTLSYPFGTAFAGGGPIFARGFTNLNARSFPHSQTRPVPLNPSKSGSTVSVAFIHSSWKESRVNDQPSYRSVLLYLAEMGDLCRRLHRNDLERDYRDAWETAALAVYGNLPARPPIAHPFFDHAPRNADTVTRRQMWESPLRLVKFRVECGHRIFTLGQSPARRRRCSECRQAAVIAETRKPARAAAAGGQMGVKQA